LHARIGKYAAFTIPVLALIYALCAGLRTVGDMDLGWQLATGRWIAQHHRIPFTDILSYTASGHEWIYPVLSQLIFYALYLVGGYALLSWFSAAACVATIAVMLRGNRITQFLAVLAVPLIAAHTAPRAELFTQLLFAIFVSVLWTYYRSGRAPLWTLPLLMFLWVNLHLGFLAGLGMCAAYVFLELGDTLVAGRRPVALTKLRSFVPWLLATIGTTLLNPWGARNYLGMVTLLPIQRNRWIVELMGIPLTPSTVAQAFALRDPRSAFWCLFLISIVATLIALSLRRLAPAIILGLSIYFVFHAIRFQGLFATVVVVIGGAILGDGIDVASRLWPGIKLACSKFIPIPAILSVMVLTALVSIRVSDLVTNRYYLQTPHLFSLFGPGESSWYPEDAATFLKRERLPGNIFNDYNIGGFVSWRLSPQYPDYVDGRGTPFGERLLFRSFELLGESLDSPKWHDEATSRNINTVLVSVDHELGGGLSDLSAYCDSERWRPVHLDTHAAIFVRLTSETGGLISRLQIDCNKVHFDNPPAAIGYRGRAEQFNYYLNAAFILVVLNRNVEALDVLDRAEHIFSENGYLHYAKGAALQNIGQWAKAEQELRSSLRIDFDDNAAMALARLYEQQDRYADEAAVLSRAVERSSQPHWLYLKLGYAQLALGEPRQALTSFDRAEKASPFGEQATKLGTTFRSQITEGRRRAHAAL
jgi:hypothetical protein